MVLTFFMGELYHSLPIWNQLLLLDCHACCLDRVIVISGKKIIVSDISNCVM